MLTSIKILTHTRTQIDWQDISNFVRCVQYLYTSVNQSQNLTSLKSWVACELSNQKEIIGKKSQEGF